MATQKVKINGVEYEVKTLHIPLADGSGNAVFPDTSDANAGAAMILEGYSGYVDGEKVEGTVPLLPGLQGYISKKDDVIEIEYGVHPEGGTVEISSTEKAKIIASNIRKGIAILGVTGTMDPQEGVVEQAKTVTPTKSQQVVSPDSGYTHLSQVTVAAIPAAYITTTDATATAADIVKGKTAYVNGNKITGSHTDPTFTLANGVLTIA